MRLTWSDNLVDVELDIAEAARVISEALRDGVRDACADGAAEARSTHKYQDRTGGLTASISGRVLVSTPGAALGEIRATKEYASYVEGGTAPHVIEPRRAGALRFQIGGRTVFATKVNHPGTQPKPFMAQAHLKAERVLQARIEAGIERARKIIED
jgi:hypothetical protein